MSVGNLDMVIDILLSCLKMTGRADAARDVLIDGIKHLPNSKLLLEVPLFF